MEDTSIASSDHEIYDPSGTRKGKSSKTISLDGLPTIFEKSSDISTLERIVKEVKPPNSTIPTDNQVFVDGNIDNPDVDFIKKHFYEEGKLSISQATAILKKARDILSKEPNVIETNPEITICGDIHGQYYDLMKLFEVGGDPKNTNYLFLGDYVDRGYFSIECLLYLYSLKIKYRDTFFMLRGNHECKHLTSYFTFKLECTHKYSKKIYSLATESFKSLPLACIVNRQFLCLHGGIGPSIQTIEDIKSIYRFIEPPTQGKLSDLLWSDPTENFGHERKKSLFIQNHSRGCSYKYSYDAVCNFLTENNLLSLIRAHEAQDVGYRLYRKSRESGFPALMTVFSAPNYVDVYNNKAAVLKYGNDNSLNIRQFGSSEHPYHLPNFIDVFNWSLPFVAEKVSEMLLSILSICTKYEPENQNTNVKKPDIDRIENGDTTFEQNMNKQTKKSVVSESIAKKIFAIGKMARLFRVLREEAETVSELKSILGVDSLPAGQLSSGIDGLRKAIISFEEAKEGDIDNEKLPPMKSHSSSNKRKIISSTTHAKMYNLSDKKGIKKTDSSETSSSSGFYDSDDETTE
ncbi:hypothetical protein BB559_004477 [Furculomyces boomerangus]|uniref:Serine/threonine-protein phosphatase n=2 Tax=Harpellales TaxID=61421 RepID=A0A2T9Y8J3_9FUNG|nr:hypothetical protein BB559_005468 [Furculomyces boomerangus]PVU90723.1 hypothetical protein BB559_004477 [Furculomyces boomerangus]PWA00029.1 hypothetical protein BB558_003927 [Smittium angustum]PWA02540.1 hypothetical protein BB558_001331 [Smittium angustum]